MVSAKLGSIIKIANKVVVYFEDMAVEPYEERDIIDNVNEGDTSVYFLV